MSKMIISGWVQVAWETGTDAYGRIPGQCFHDVAVCISTRNSQFRVVVREQAGMAQGANDQIQHDARVVARGEDLQSTIEEAKRLAIEADVDRGYLSQAVSKALDEAQEALVAD